MLQSYTFSISCVSPFQITYTVYTTSTHNVSPINFMKNNLSENRVYLYMYFRIADYFLHVNIRADVLCIFGLRPTNI